MLTGIPLHLSVPSYYPGRKEKRFQAFFNKKSGCSTLGTSVFTGFTLVNQGRTEKIMLKEDMKISNFGSSDFD